LEETEGRELFRLTVRRKKRKRKRKRKKRMRTTTNTALTSMTTI
jgi:hypothetical protein